MWWWTDVFVFSDVRCGVVSVVTVIHMNRLWRLVSESPRTTVATATTTTTSAAGIMIHPPSIATNNFLVWWMMVCYINLFNHL